MDLNEKCGVFGIYGKDDDISRSVYYGLWSLQHRGQENSGIASSNGKKIFHHKGEGLVANVYSEKDLDKLKGNIAIGHNRYSTFGKSEIDHSQPVCYHNNTIALAHNGNLPVVTRLKKFLRSKGISSHAYNDSEMMYKAIEYYVVRKKSIHDAVKLTYPLFTGAFALLIMTNNELIGVRDKLGIRPLSIGKANRSYVLSSETCALDAVGAEFIRDVKPGEMVIIDKDGLHSYQLAEGRDNLDVFEFIYFARADSHLMGKSVYQVRKNLGIELAKQVKLKADVVIPVPDSAIPSAIGFSESSGIPLEMGLIKNRYIHRTFIKPAQKQRNSSVKLKLNLIPEVVKDKRVILIDDSLVRGTTAKRLADLVRLACPKEIHMLIASPPVKYPDFYGIDTPKQEDLVAATMSLFELKNYLGVDSLSFLSFDGMISAIGVPASHLCTSCFTGEYPISIGVKLKKIKYVTV